MCITIYFSLHQELNREDIVGGGGKKEKKKVCFYRLNFFKTLYGFKSFLPQRKFKNSSMLLGAVIQNASCLCAQWLFVCEFNKQTDFHIPCTLFCFGKAKPQGHVIQMYLGLRSLFTFIG
jgi:hypothetical protein